MGFDRFFQFECGFYANINKIVSVYFIEKDDVKFSSITFTFEDGKIREYWILHLFDDLDLFDNISCILRYIGLEDLLLSIKRCINEIECED